MNYLKRLLTSGGVLLLLAFMVAPSAQAASGYNWTDDSSLSGNSATSGLLWKSVAASADGQHLVAVEQPSYFSNPTTGGDIWTSADGGTTWTDASLLPGGSGTSGLWWTSVASSADGQKVVAVAEGGGVWTSPDGGTTWTYVANFTMSGGNWESVTVSADGQYMHAMPMSGDVWSSSNGGDTWINDTWIPGNGGTHQDWQAVASSADGQKVVGGVSGGDIWTTSDDGATWVDNSALPGNSAMSGKSWQSIAMSANGQNIVAAASGGDIWTSHNGGTSWTDTSTLSGNGGTINKQWQAVASSADGQNLAAAANNGGGIWTSNDGGTSWTSATASSPLDSLEWTGLASNITGGRLTAVVGGFFSGGDIYTAINTNLPQTITASTANPVTAANVAIHIPSNTTLTCSSPVTEASLSKQDAGYDYPLGLVNLCYTTVLPNDQVTLTFVTDLTPSQVVARDFNTVTGTYTTIPGAVITQVTSGGHPALQLTYTIVDNGVLDSNPAINFVTDPVGLAVIPTANNNTSVKAPVTGFGTPTQSDSIMKLVALGALISTGAGIVLLYRREPNSQT
ncbi:MAG: hypothetical protein JWL85_192 [Candidatus Saccharibacteria bacterium]|nr:hypothetical protein [Candidatus Saccharibacteria bacterium]